MWPDRGLERTSLGLPYSGTEGIGSLPGLRKQMLGGENNIVVSEIGFCALDVDGGRYCNENRTDVDGTSAQTATWLGETLKEALPMHRAGWLKALLLWARSGGGWAIRDPGRQPHSAGRVLALFAASL